MRLYIAEHLLPQATNTPALYTLCKNYGEIPLTLTVLTHMRRSQREVTAFTLSDPDKLIGVRGIWHHGIEEILYLQQEQSLFLCRSLRHQNDDAIKQGLRWLQTHLEELRDH